MAYSFWETRGGEYFPSTWRQAREITDNRLRAMRAWCTSDNERREEILDFLVNDLIRHLNALAKGAHGETARKIHDLVAKIVYLRTKDRPYFEVVYDLLGITFPKDVGRIGRNMWSVGPYPNLDTAAQPMWRQRELQFGRRRETFRPFTTW